MSNETDYKQYRQKVKSVGYCYDMDDLDKFLNEEELKRFNKWFNGQTGCVGDKGEFFVYEWDMDRFIQQIRRK
jgi:vacuolar-type H+-ATPase subunit C/Vma6